MSLSYILSLFFLVFGFGFVIFWHELGHFLAAKWVGIRVEQFAVGMGHAIFSWRKGIGFRAGNTQKEYERRAREQAEKKLALDPGDKPELTNRQINDAAAEIGLGDTEYRLNWIPIGGYVKMLGQDDMNPNATSEDPRSYNRKSIGARMLVVSAGVVMNIILAAVGFMVLFLVGFDVPPSVVGTVVAGSPAQKADVRSADHLISLDGTNVENNFTKVMLNAALQRDGEEVILKVERDGQLMDLKITPRRPGPKQLVAMGITDPRELSAPKQFEISKEDESLLSKDSLLLKPGDTIVEVGGIPVKPEQYAVLDAALQNSFGAPVKIVIQSKDEKTPPRTAEVHPVLDTNRFGGEQLNFAGMVPRAAVGGVTEKSSARNKLFVDDAVVALSVTGSSDTIKNPSSRQLREFLSKAGGNGQKVDITVLRGTERKVVAGLEPNVKLSQPTGGRGLGIGLALDVNHVVIAEVLQGSPAETAKIPAGAEILAIGGKQVSSWNDVFRNLSAAKAGEPIEVSFKTQNTEQKTEKLTLSAAQLDDLTSTRYTHELMLAPRIVPQHTKNPLIAAKWGVLETRDFILQFYLTLRRFADGTVSPTNAMGPVGIFHAGTNVASRGNDWMLWFLCMISANLAVVNFLPIPIVDGGLFLFLVLEKIKGKPLSPKAQYAAQVAGLLLLAGVFLFVTYNDISRMIF